MTLADNELASVTHVFVICHRVYSNAVYLGMKPSGLRKLQIIQNTAACPLNNTIYNKHIIGYRVKFKVFVL